MDEDILIQQIAERNTQALADLYDRCGRLVFSLSVSLLNDAGLAEEVTQDVFVQVWQKAGTYRPELGKVTTWLLSITRHRAIDMMRRRKVRPEGHWVGLENVLFSEDGAAAVEPQVLLRFQQGRVRRALAELPPEQRSALALAYFQGLTQQEVAERLNEPLGTVKTRIRLAMSKLRQMLLEESLP